MPRFTETGSLYFTPIGIGADLNGIPQLVQPIEQCQSMACNIHRGDPRASYDPGALGIVVNQLSYGYFDPRYAAWLKAGASVFVARTGESFKIHGIPSVRVRFGPTAHVRCLLNLYLVAPQGMPRIFYDTGYSYPVIGSTGSDTYVPG